MSVSSHATTPAEVLTSYNAYRTALDKNDKKSATKHAYEAWQTAEKLLGDHKATGDLAFNYAEITPPRRIKNRHKNYEKRAKAYKRAIKLVHFHGDDVPVRELERRINLAELELTVRRGNRIGKFGTLKDIEKAIHSHGQEGSTFDADLHALYAQYYLANRKFEKAIEYGEKAIKLYESRTDGYVSKHEYFIRVFKGDSHIALSDKNDDLSEKVNAALEYQNVMQNLEGTLPPDHVFVKTAFRKWMKTRSDIESAGKLEEAEAAGLCECWPFEDYKNKVIPLVRVPPMMPSGAKKSGHVNVMYDVTEAGKPDNVRIVSSSAPIFEKGAIKAIGKWQYSKPAPEADPKNRQDISARINFFLRSSNGNLIPE